MALARSDNVFFLIESRFGVELVVYHFASKAKYLVLLSGSGFRQLCMEELHYTALGGHLGVYKL